MGIESIAAAALAGLGAFNKYQTLKKQDNAAAAGIQRNMALQQQANQRLSQALQKQSQSNPAAITAQQNQSYLDQLRANQQAAQQRLMRQGLGQAYAERAQSNAAGEIDYADQLAWLMAQIDAPGLQRQQEHYDFGDLGTDLGVIGSNAAGNQFVTKMNVKGIRSNPWLQGLGQFGSAYLSGGH